MQEPPTMTRQPPLGGAAGVRDESEIRLKDLQVFHWWFFLRGYETRFVDETEQYRDEHWRVWLKALDDAMEWAGGWELSSIPRPPEEEPPDTDYPSEFADTGRLPVGGLWRFLGAYSLLDTTYLNVVWTAEGEVAPGTLSGIRRLDEYQAGGESPPYFGDAVCLSATMVGVTKEAKSKAVEDGAKRLAKHCLEDWCEKGIGEVVLIEFACGYYATTHDIRETVWVLLLWDSEAAAEEAGHILLDLTPPFMLAWLKGRFIRNRYDEELHPKARRAESRIRSRLDRADPMPVTLKTVEEVGLHISAPLSQLPFWIGRILNDIGTLEINRDNLKVLLTDAVFKPGQEQMSSLFVSPLSQSAQQLRVDLTYMENTRDEAQSRLDMIKLRADILAQKKTRDLTVLLGLFVIFGVVQAFNDEIRARWPSHSLFAKAVILFIFLLPLLGYLKRHED